MRTIFFVRHADKVSDKTDAPFSEQGRRRAECLANTLADARLQIVAMQVSLKIWWTLELVTYVIHIPATKIAHWYFRLNGFLGVENFVLHPEDRKRSQRTDADFYGVRFQYHSELNMEDDAPFKNGRKGPLSVIAEITRGTCKLNGPWTDPAKENMQYVLRAIGAFHPDEINAIAQSLSRYCTYPEPGANREPVIQLIAVGKSASKNLEKQFPSLLQIELAGMLSFIYRRFEEYRLQKADHPQWDQFGRALWDEVEKHEQDTFVMKMMKRIL